MVREVMASQCGILFDDEALARNSIPTTITFPPTLPELDDDKADAVQPIHDELKLNPLWWIVELFPLRYLWQDANGVWHTSYGFVAISRVCPEKLTYFVPYLPSW
jgi:hypothetical protein